MPPGSRRGSFSRCVTSRPRLWTVRCRQLAHIRRLPDQEIVERLSQRARDRDVDAEMLLIFRLGRPDVFPVRRIMEFARGICYDLREGESAGKPITADMLPKPEQIGAAGGEMEAVALGGELVLVAGLRASCRGGGKDLKIDRARG